MGDDVMTKREILALVRAYYLITNEEVRRILLEMVRVIARNRWSREGFCQLNRARE